MKGDKGFFPGKRTAISVEYKKNTRDWYETGIAPHKQYEKAWNYNLQCICYPHISSLAKKETNDFVTAASRGMDWRIEFRAEITQEHEITQ